MNFYTNVIQRGNYICVREVKNGQRMNSRVRYSPTLFSPVKEETGYKTLDGSHVLPTQFYNIKDAREWIESHKSQPELVYGNTQYPYCYIADKYKGVVNWDMDQILIVTIDIEVQCENGFPSVLEAQEELLSITLKNHQNKKLIVKVVLVQQDKKLDICYK